MLPSSVSIIEEISDYPILEVNHSMASGRIALNGAHVMSWIPKGSKPVLYMSPQAALEPGKAIRGGIPICWPWFGPHPTDHSLPSHGFVRNLMWTLVNASENLTGVTLEFTLSSSELSLPIWPHSFSLRLEVKMGTTLSIDLHITNTDTSEWPMTGALHTYLCVDDVREAAVMGLDDSFYVESRLSPERIEQSGPIYFDREIDRLYDSRNTVRLMDRTGRRTVVVDKGGSRATVVWNPWIEKSQRLNDLPDDAYPYFVCIEAANAGHQIITLPPGENHTLSQRLRIQPF